MKRSRHSMKKQVQRDIESAMELIQRDWLCKTCGKVMTDYESESAQNCSSCEDYRRAVENGLFDDDEETSETCDWCGFLEEHCECGLNDVVEVDDDYYEDEEDLS